MDSTARRPDLYTAVHKGLRALMFDTLGVVARCDPSDAFDVERAAQQVHLLVRLCDVHLADENAFIHPALEARSPGVVREAAAAHDAQCEDTAALSSLALRLEHGFSDDPAAVLAQLSRRLGAFIAHSLEHMDLEETRHTPALWATHTDDELHALHAAIVSAISPDDMAHFQRWMLPAMSHPERVGMLSELAAGAPPAAFREVLGVARAQLSPRDFRKLTDALGRDLPDHAPLEPAAQSLGA